MTPSPLSVTTRVTKRKADDTEPKVPESASSPDSLSPSPRRKLPKSLPRSKHYKHSIIGPGLKLLTSDRGRFRSSDAMPLIWRPTPRVSKRKADDTDAENAGSDSLPGFQLFPPRKKLPKPLPKLKRPIHRASTPPTPTPASQSAGPSTGKVWPPFHSAMAHQVHANLVNGAAAVNTAHSAQGMSQSVAPFTGLDIAAAGPAAGAGTEATTGAALTIAPTSPAAPLITADTGITSGPVPAAAAFAIAPAPSMPAVSSPAFPNARALCAHEVFANAVAATNALLGTQAIAAAATISAASPASGQATSPFAAAAIGAAPPASAQATSPFAAAAIIAAPAAAAVGAAPVAQASSPLAATAIGAAPAAQASMPFGPVGVAAAAVTSVDDIAGSNAAANRPESNILATLSFDLIAQGEAILKELLEVRKCDGMLLEKAQEDLKLSEEANAQNKLMLEEVQKELKETKAKLNEIRQAVDAVNKVL